MKTRSISLTGLMLAIILILSGCSSGPPDENVKQLVEKTLKREVPMELVRGERFSLARKATDVEAINILKMGKPEKVKILGSTITYWPINVEVKGRCKDRFDINEGVFDFEGEMKIFVYKDPRSDEWNLWKDESVINMYK